MISKATIKAYEFETIKDYFIYILESEINGQRSQVHNLIDELSKQQKKDCLSLLNEEHGGPDAEIVKQILIKSI
jgi:hypothetical protein